jgi:hypothetical protein
MIMLFSDGKKRFLFFVLSIYVFVQCTFFMADTAQLLFTLSSPRIAFDGQPILLSPYNIISYCNIVLYSGIIISGFLFMVSAEPIIRHRLKNRVLISIPLVIIVTPFYFMLLYLIFQGVQSLFN